VETPIALHRTTYDAGHVAGDLAPDGRRVGRPIAGRVAHPDYFDPVTALDWTAVWLYSAVLLLFAPSLVLLGRLATSRSVMTFAAISAIGALVAGGANAVEDGFSVAIGGTLYVVGFMTMWLALLPLAVTLYRAPCSRLDSSSSVGWVPSRSRPPGSPDPGPRQPAPPTRHRLDKYSPIDERRPVLSHG